MNVRKNVFSLLGAAVIMLAAGFVIAGCSNSAGGGGGYLSRKSGSIH